MTLDDFKKKAKKMPDAPGVYFFLGPKKEVLYIGKATSLRDRTRSYFAPDIAQVRSRLIANMVLRAKTIDWRETDSVLEALILEAHLIKTHKPRYNTDEKDDKSWNYVLFSNETFPALSLMRGKELAEHADVALHVFGPFPHGMQLKEALKLIRKIFPYRDSKCVPCAEQLEKKTLRCRPCFNRSIGLCPGVCTGEISKAEYSKIIKRLVLLFEGKKNTLLKSLEKDMQRAAKDEAFEEAALLRRQVFALTHIQDVSLIKEEYRSAAFSPHRSRIEAYDVAHLGGSGAVGVMTVVEDGAARPREYRKFRIKSAKAGDDPGSLREILSRRLGHDEWPLPRLIVVDGATAQMNVAQEVLTTLGLKIPIVGVVKDEKHRPREIRGFATPAPTDIQRDVLLANAEAHRFAIGYQRKTRRVV